LTLQRQILFAWSDQAKTRKGENPINAVPLYSRPWDSRPQGTDIHINDHLLQGWIGNLKLYSGGLFGF